MPRRNPPPTTPYIPPRHGPTYTGSTAAQTYKLYMAVDKDGRPKWTLAEIGARRGCSRQAVFDMVKKYGWVRGKNRVGPRKGLDKGGRAG